MEKLATPRTTTVERWATRLKKEQSYTPANGAFAPAFAPFEPSTAAKLIMRRRLRQTSHTEGTDSHPALLSPHRDWNNLTPGGHWPMGDIVRQYRKNLWSDEAYSNSEQKVEDVIELAFSPETAAEIELPHRAHVSPYYSGIPPNPIPDQEPAINCCLGSWKRWRRQICSLPGCLSLRRSTDQYQPDHVVVIVCRYQSANDGIAEAYRSRLEGSQLASREARPATAMACRFFS